MKKEKISKKKFEDLEDGAAFKPIEIGTSLTMKYWGSQKNINSKEFNILCILLSFDHLVDGCYPGQDEISKYSHQHKKSIKRHLKSLRKKGYLAYTPSVGQGHKTYYTFQFVKGDRPVSPFIESKRGQNDPIKGDKMSPKRGQNETTKGTELCPPKDFKDCKDLKEYSNPPTPFEKGGDKICGVTSPPAATTPPTTKEVLKVTKVVKTSPPKKEEDLSPEELELAQWLKVNIFKENHPGYLTWSPLVIIRTIWELFKSNVPIALIKEVLQWNESRGNPTTIRDPRSICYNWSKLLGIYYKKSGKLPQNHVSKQIALMNKEDWAQDQYKYFSKLEERDREQKEGSIEEEVPKEKLPVMVWYSHLTGKIYYDQEQVNYNEDEEWEFMEKMTHENAVESQCQFELKEQELEKERQRGLSNEQGKTCSISE